MTRANQEARVPGLGDLFDGFPNMLPDAADNPVWQDVDGSGGEMETFGLNGTNNNTTTLF